MGWFRRCAAVGLIVAVGLISGGSVATGAGDGPSGAQLEAEAGRLLSAASDYVDRHHPCCRLPSPLAAEPKLVRGPPAHALLAELAYLRRPGTVSRARINSLRSQASEVARIYVNYVRVAHAVDGRTIILVPVHPDALRPTTRPCLVRVYARLRTLLRDKPLDLRRIVLREEAEITRQGPDELAELNRGEDLVGGATAEVIRRSGEFTATSASTIRGPSEVSGVVPDGVVSLTVRYGRVPNRGVYRSPTVYPSRVVRTVRVRDNVVDFTVPRPAEDASPGSVTWHLTGGRTQAAPQPYAAAVGG